jgi:hypothetical protein
LCAARSCLFNHLLSFSGVSSRFSNAIPPLNAHSGLVHSPVFTGRAHRSAKNGQPGEVCLGSGVVAREVGVPTAHSLDNGRANGKRFGVVLTFRERRFEAAGHMTCVPTQAQALQRDGGDTGGR